MPAGSSTGNRLYTELCRGHISLVIPKLGQRVLQLSHYRCQGMGQSHQPKANDREELADAPWCSLGPNSFTSAARLAKVLQDVLAQASPDVTLFITCSSGHQYC